MKFRFCGDLDCPDWVLAEISTLSKLTSIRLKVLVSQIIMACTQGVMDFAKIIKLANDNSDGIADIKGAVAAVHFILTSAAKYDTDDQVLVQEIQQLGLPKENSDTIAKQYRETKDILRTSLENQSYRLSKLISSDWRVDQVLAFSTKPTTSSPSGYSLESQKTVHLNLKVDTNPDVQSNHQIKNLSLELSPNQLDILVEELKNIHQMMVNLDA